MLLGYKPTWVPYDDNPRLRLRVIESAPVAGSVPEKNPAPLHQDPRWLRLVEAVMRALIPFAEARDAVCRELSAAAPENSS